ncbi:hypothetical protein HNP84_009279 [Thermocatellispora tengchongensis]|uniref:DUF2530 domain-containing protein n=1 Tax=Thermocatellispora tengchongensis TaxID=1073253 RepID=A0A840PKR7_9ACTN|nr:DUF2530 domain-containing protein [Thermocatellispora tengchongensis]MBB5139516.1 hypothetical protein [Thermocatellispora tengchongensis]
MTQPHRRPDLEPMKTNDSATFLAGTALWAVAAIVLLIVQPSPDQRWWLWTCLAGIAGGLFGLFYVRRRNRRAPTPPSDPPVEPSTAVPPNTKNLQ